MKKNKVMLFLLVLCLSASQYAVAENSVFVFFKVLFNLDNNNQPRPQEEEVPAQVTPEDYLTQLRHDLRPIPQEDIDAITSTARRKVDWFAGRRSQNNDRVNQQLRSVIVDHVESQARIIAGRHTNDSARIERVAKSMRENVRTRLERISYPNGEALNPYFGNELAKIIQDDLQSPSAYHGSSSPRPSSHSYGAPPARPAPPVPTSSRPDDALV